VRKQQGIVLLNIILVSVVVLGALLFVVSLSNNTQSYINYSLIEQSAEFALIAAVDIGQNKLEHLPKECPKGFVFQNNAGTLADFEVDYQCERVASYPKLVKVRVHKGEQFAPEYITKSYHFKS